MRNAVLFHREGERAFVQHRSTASSSGIHVLQPRSLSVEATAVSGAYSSATVQISACTFVVSTSDVSTLA